MNAKWQQTNESETSASLRESKLSRKWFIRASLMAACGVALSASAGCSWWRSVTGQKVQDDTSGATRTTSRPASTQTSTIDIAPVPPVLVANRPVVQGPLPLFYLVENDGTLRIRNVQSGEEIITFSAKAMQIVRVDTAGVFLANKPVIGATLVPGQYSIEIIPPGESGIRSTQQRNVLQNH